ncbi:hypothetical protein BJX61DRAFT_533004 [Aspergillus egyptiacus]|nr:hypothetical protein BJX61DRAFT_533004 [Aspergillus egyptiacus]
MPRPKRKAKAEDLTRVRNNQRRCRQRQRDYVAELERRLASIEDTTSREIQRLQSLTDGLRMENERLAALLGSLGVDYALAGSCRQRENVNTENIPGHRDLVAAADGFIVGPTENTSLGDISQLYFNQSDSQSAEKFEDYSFLDINYHPIPPAIELEPSSQSLFVSQQHLSESTSLNTEASKDEFQDTTVCAVALELVMNCNTKNLSILDLDMRLRCGYRSARFQWEGCRVDNQVLFAVLAEIMG